MHYVVLSIVSLKEYQESTFRSSLATGITTSSFWRGLGSVLVQVQTNTCIYGYKSMDYQDEVLWLYKTR